MTEPNETTKAEEQETVEAAESAGGDESTELGGLCRCR